MPLFVDVLTRYISAEWHGLGVTGQGYSAETYRVKSTKYDASIPADKPKVVIRTTNCEMDAQETNCDTVIRQHGVGWAKHRQLANRLLRRQIERRIPSIHQYSQNVKVDKAIMNKFGLSEISNEKQKPVTRTNSKSRSSIQSAGPDIR